MRIRFLRLISSCALLTSLAPAQQIFRTRSTGSDANTITVVFDVKLDGPPLRALAHRNAPYAADHVSEHTQTLADGTHIFQSETQHFARDSQGRTRTDRRLVAPRKGGAPIPLIAEIHDPVAGFVYLLDDQNKVVHRVAMPPAPPAARPAAIATGPARPADMLPSDTDPLLPQFANEKLSPESIEGIMAEGRRVTITYPVDSRGNDRPLTETREYWTSTELGVEVLSKSSTWMDGERVTKLINIIRAEPDASLFQPPPGYTIVDEKDSFKITLKRP